MNKKEINFEDKLWKAADKLRNNMDAAEYKHVVLGLIFLKYISDAFEEKYNQLKIDFENPRSEWYIKEPVAKYEALNDKDEYRAENVFFVPKQARWSYLQSVAKQPEIGKYVDEAMEAIEKDNPSLKGVLPKNYARPALDKQRLGELIDLIGTIGLGDKENRSKDVLGRIYEYFIGMFADAEGKRGGQFYTARCVVKLLVKMLEPYKGRVYDPCCGSGGMFVQSEKFIESHGGKIGDISVYGQESNSTTWRLCKMNLAIRGIDENITWGDSFTDDKHKDLKADFLLANPPFNDSDWKGELLRDDPRWRYGIPPVGNANFAWVQHFIYHLSPAGIAGFVLSNGSMSAGGIEGEIRENIIEADLVDCMTALPGQLFYNTMIPVCLWFISRDKKNHKYKNRQGQILFIDARKMGVMVDRRHRELTDEEIKSISDTYHSWRGKGGKYDDIKGFCKSENIDKIKEHGFILTPGRYVGTGDIEDDVEPFNEKMERLTKELAEMFENSNKLEKEIKKNLNELGYDL